MSTTAEPWLSYTFTWHTFAGCCNQCYQLDGRVWSQQPTLTGSLSDPASGGDVYDLDSDLSLTHPHCRCWLEVQVHVDLAQIPEFQGFSEQAATLRGIKVGGSIVPSMQTSFTSTGGLELLRQQVGELKAEVFDTTMSLRECEYLLFRVTGLMGRMGLPPPVDAAINKLQKMVLIVRVLTGAMMLMGRATPFGIISALVTMVGGVMATATLMDMERPIY